MKPLARLLAEQLTSLSASRVLLRYLCKRRVLSPLVWQRLPVGIEFEQVLPGGQILRYASHPSEAVGRYLFWKGGLAYEPETAGLIMKLASDVRAFVDIGANTGYFSILAGLVNPQLRIVSFEPVPFTRGLLTRNVELNGLRSRCEIRAEAIAESVGKSFVCVPEGQGVASAEASLHADRGPSGIRIEVNVTSIDEFWRDRGPCDLVKMDVEGSEDKVLQGMVHTLTKWRPIVIFECLPGGPASNITDIFRQYGYSLYRIASNGLQRLMEVIPDASYQTRNFLALPSGREIPTNVHQL